MNPAIRPKERKKKLSNMTNSEIEKHLRNLGLKRCQPKSQSKPVTQRARSRKLTKNEMNDFLRLLNEYRANKTGKKFFPYQIPVSNEAVLEFGHFEKRNRF